MTLNFGTLKSLTKKPDWKKIILNLIFLDSFYYQSLKVILVNIFNKVLLFIHKINSIDQNLTYR